jgi:hypothetical protein
MGKNRPFFEKKRAVFLELWLVAWYNAQCSRRGCAAIVR